METDEEGFLYPHVDEAHCIHCGLCEKVCPVTTQEDILREPVAYAVRSLEDNIRRVSSSGGVFSELAKNVIEANGIVFGAAFDETFCVRHIWIDSLEDLEKLRGSKYVQSRIGESYRQVKDFLQQGRLVLFTGTPCQISGLYGYLGGDHENLITQDIICHGVPSPAVWEKYVQYRQIQANKKLNRVSFRNKENGWKIFQLCMDFDGGPRYIKNIADDLYMRSFLSNLCLRPSCHQCAFKTKIRKSDITLADFWGIEKIVPDMNDNKGTSLVVIHSQQGRDLFETIKERLVYQQVDLNQAIQYNTAATCSVVPHPKRDEFMAYIMKNGSWETLQRFLQPPVTVRIKNIAKKILRKIMRRNSK